MREGPSLALDIGGTKIAAGLVGPSGLRGEPRTIATDAAAGGSAVLNRAIGLAREVLVRDRDVSAVGVATGGWPDPETGRIQAATSLLPGWAGISLTEAFERALKLSAIALNDVHAMGVAEARLGAGRDKRVCLSVAVGTGIGGAITIGGRLLVGSRGFAGAVGHIPFRPRGSVCSCGRRGCLETEASGPAIARAFRACVGRLVGPVAATGDSAAMGLPAVVQALASPDEGLRTCARRVVASAAARAGRTLGGIANTVDPDVIIVGGGAAAALGEHFLVPFRAAIAEVVLQPGLEVLPAALAPWSSVIGAGLVALERSLNPV